MSIEVIAELGINFNGNMTTAKQLISVAVVGGCHFVKFQKRDIDLVYTKEELDSPRESPWGTTFREQKAGLEFGIKEYDEVDAFCKSMGIRWFASVWDVNSFDFINSYDVPFIKIPSALITNDKLLNKTKETNKGIILSTGMSTIDMIDHAVEVVGKDRIYSIMHCTSTYPCHSAEMNLNCIKTYKERYPFTKIGFSNHSPGLPYIPAAIALGAEMIEFHITLDRSMYGSDQAASIEPAGIMHIGKWARSLEGGLGDGIKRIYSSEESIIKKLRR